MRGISEKQAVMLSLISPESRVPQDHPLRRIKAMADQELEKLSRIFDDMYSYTGRPSIPPERVLKSLVLIALYSVRSERQFCEQLNYNLLFRWFLEMNMVEESFDPTVFTKNRERWMEHEVGRRFFDAVVRQAREAGLMSDDHFTVDGTLIEAWASLKSFRPKGEKGSQRPTDGDPGNPTVDFRGEKRSNQTHESTTDPESRLIRKSRGKEAKLSYGAHLLMENRNGLLVDLRITRATGTAEEEGAEAMLKRQSRKRIRPRTLGMDKGYDTKGFVSILRRRKITPHVAQNSERRGGSAIDGRTTRHWGYEVSQRIRKRVEEINGWIKAVGGFRRTRFKGEARTQLAGWFVGVAYNLLRMAKLMPQGAVV
ncbi:MAG TPA: IS5 family transposase [Thermodesulfobacteriota bacterium]|nr:IS5 family transposase [Thermodesulfobacteriota bacterium]